VAALWLATAIAGTCPAADAQIDPLDWTQWRGPEQNGISRETGLVSEWEVDGENMLWKSEELGGRSTPIVMHGKLYTIVADKPDTPAQREKVICADAATGDVLWESPFNVFSTDVPLERVGWSCCTGDPVENRIYAMGVCGYFQCLDADTGQTIWSRSLSEEFGLLSTYGGRTNTPVLFEDLVIINAVFINWGNTDTKWEYQAFDPKTGGWGDMAKPAHRYLAMDKHTGEVVWFNGTRLLPDDTTYSTPFVTTIDGQPLLIFGSGDGACYGMQPRTGNIVWKYQISLRGMNVSPIVAGETVYMSQSEENFNETTRMGTVTAFSAAGRGDITESSQVWRFPDFMIGKSSPLLVDDRLYMIDDGAGLFIFDPQTGQPLFGKNNRAVMKLGSIMRASPLYADGRIYACEMNGRWWILEPTDKGVKAVHKLRLDGEEGHGSAIVSHGRIYVPTTEHLYCLGTADHEPQATERPAEPEESPVSDDPRPAHVQVVPADALLSPGEQRQFTALVFNSRGQQLRKAREDEVEFAIEGDGEIDPLTGWYAAGSTPEHRAVLVKVTVGDLTGYARIRVVPPLPWKFDFSDKQVPITWVGARYRHQVRELDGEQVMVKVTTIPKGTRSQAWMGQIDLHDYTIQADIRGAVKNDQLPDIGLQAQRYTLDLMGNSQQLQLRSWAPEIARRRTATVPLAWKPDTWYTMKLRAANEGDTAVLQGKVWVRGEEEPEEWNIELVDESPNRTGSPGLFGNASNAEIYIDNLTVVSNDGGQTAGQ
jgi:outer membrane protein assembly factor BamB